MKKFLLFASLAASVVFSTACDKDDEESCPSGESIQTRIQADAGAISTATLQFVANPSAESCDGIIDEADALLSYLKDNESCIVGVTVDGETATQSDFDQTVAQIEAMKAQVNTTCELINSL